MTQGSQELRHLAEGFTRVAGAIKRGEIYGWKQDAKSCLVQAKRLTKMADKVDELIKKVKTHPFAP